MKKRLGKQGMAERTGALLIVGGNEDRDGDMQVLSEFVELCGGADRSIVVLTAASSVPGRVWAIYDNAFAELGVRNRAVIHIENRRAADEPRIAEKILHADGIFMSGGEQQRLLTSIGGSGALVAMQRAFRERGACIGGTSAGAAAISRQMLAYGTKDLLPEKNTAQLDTGLGFLQHIVIDQHFSERHRLARLLSAVAQNPSVIGMGIDEDTAVVIRGRNLEVVGAGAVTLLDGRHMTSNLEDVDAQQQLELIDVRLHLLPAGNHYNIEADAAAGSDTGANGEPPVADIPAALREILAVVTET